VTEADEFSRILLEESKRFLELADECDDPSGATAYLHAALMLSFCALEAYINAVADDMLAGSALTLHERAILSESEVRFEDGEFKITKTLRMVRLEDRIHLLHFKFAQAKIDKQSPWWSAFKASIDLRNQLTHSKGAPAIGRNDVERAIAAVIEALSIIFRAVFKTDFPPALRGLQSKMDFR